MTIEAQRNDGRHQSCRIEGDGGDLPMASQIHEPNRKSRFAATRRILDARSQGTYRGHDPGRIGHHRLVG